MWSLHFKVFPNSQLQHKYSSCLFTDIVGLQPYNGSVVQYKTNHQKSPPPPQKKMFVLGTDDTDSVFKSNKKIGVWQNIYFRLHNEGWQIVKLNVVQSYTESRDSSVGTASRYGLVGPAIESGGDEIFRTCPDRPGGPPILLHNGYRIFPGGKAAGAWC